MASSDQAADSNKSPSSAPFNLMAAGHQGITTDASGSLLIKPCTQAEIDFYESAKSHPAFQAHMPIFIGSLTLNTNPTVITAATGAEASSSAPPPPPPPETHKALTPTETNTTPNTNDTTWKPSGGAKLNSGLGIVLSNATAGFKRPSVMDLKLGARLWADDAPPAKRQRLDDVASSSTSGTLGFRVAGMKVYIGEDDAENVLREVNTTVSHGYKSYDKIYGRSNIQTENIRSAFEGFLLSMDLPRSNSGISATDTYTHVEGKMLRRKVLERLCREVESIRYTLEAEESRMYSASILMVYEGDPEALEEAIAYREAEAQNEETQQDDEGTDDGVDEGDEDDEDDEDEEKYKVHEVVMIDFAHAHWTPGQGPDENVLKGVRSIYKILHEMLEELG